MIRSFCYSITGGGKPIENYVDFKEQKYDKDET